MKHVLMRADDLGYSEGVNYGIEKSVREGIIGNVGIMVNMDASEHGVKLFSGLNVCLGLHTNISSGKPISTPTEVPSLVNENGLFKSSREYNSAAQDFVVLDEALQEIDAQVKRYIALVGQKPEYFDFHAVVSANFLKALQIVANRYNLRYPELQYNQSGSCPKVTYSINGQQVILFCGSASEARDYDPDSYFWSELDAAEDDSYLMFVFHPGYIDNMLLSSSSLTISRVKDVAMLTSEKTKQGILQRGCQLITYSDLYNKLSG